MTTQKLNELHDEVNELSCAIDSNGAIAWLKRTQELFVNVKSDKMTKKGKAEYDKFAAQLAKAVELGSKVSARYYENQKQISRHYEQKRNNK